MANTYTPTYNLIQPEVGSDTNTWGAHVNTDLLTVDNHMVSRIFTTLQSFAGPITLPSNGLNVGSGQLNVTGGNVSMSGQLAVTGATSISSTLTVSSNSYLQGTLALTGAAALSSTLAVSGATTLAYNGLNVGSGQLNCTAGNVYMSGALAVTGAGSFGSISSGSISSNAINTNGYNLTCGAISASTISSTSINTNGYGITCGTIGSGAITCTTINTQNNTITAGAINCGAISSTAINTNGNSLTSGSISTGAIGSGAITCTSINTQGNTINAGTISCGSLNTNSNGITCGPISCTTINLNGNTLTVGAVNASGNISTSGVTTITNSTSQYQANTGGYSWSFLSNSANSGVYRNSVGNWAFYSDTSGNFTAVGNVTAYSDARLKKDVETVRDAVAIVKRLRGVFYNRIEDDKAGVGVIAQEIREVLPQVVNENDGTLSVAYGNISGVLIEAIKELNARLAKLEAA